MKLLAQIVGIIPLIVCGPSVQPMSSEDVSSFSNNIKEILSSVPIMISEKCPTENYFNLLISFFKLDQLLENSSDEYEAAKEQLTELMNKCKPHHPSVNYRAYAKLVASLIDTCYHLGRRMCDCKPIIKEILSQGFSVDFLGPTGI